MQTTVFINPREFAGREEIVEKLRAASVNVYVEGDIYHFILQEGSRTMVLSILRETEIEYQVAYSHTG